MPVSRVVMDAAVALVAGFCAERSPQESRDSYRIEHAVRGTSITIVERRPPWNPAFGSDWSSVKVSQLRFDERTRRWTLYAAGSDDRWYVYEFSAPAPDVAPLLAAIEQDRTGIFWG